MSSRPTVKRKPLNPVRVSVLQRGGRGESIYTGVLFDYLDEQYRFRTNDELVPGTRYIVNTELVDERTVEITDSWQHTIHR